MNSKRPKAVAYIVPCFYNTEDEGLDGTRVEGQLKHFYHGNQEKFPVFVYQYMLFAIKNREIVSKEAMAKMQKHQLGSKKGQLIVIRKEVVTKEVMYQVKEVSCKEKKRMSIKNDKDKKQI
ncbi:conserved hypothetical protein [Ricinus communis]|uniref:Uncharacterized protein n=1 Tax=Ricinus communis TaxID=3988 RepID=B9SU67_RICCO|nr:conserved hypothetical protein [Ricinus communis]